MNKIMAKVRSYAEVIQRIKNLKGRSDSFEISKLGEIHCVQESYEMFCLQVGASTNLQTKRIFLSAGIHGDEPAGVEAILTFLEHFHEYAVLLEGVKATILPCDNPFGYERDRRENADGFDLNQQFQAPNSTQETRLINKVIGQRSFDMALSFHEDVEGEGFYLWERKCPPLKSMGELVMQRMAQEYPIEPKAKIEGFPNRQGVISLDKRYLEKGWTQEYYLFRQGTKYCFTLESPASMSFQKRVEMHLLALRTSVKLLCQS
jgi:hypothetical protein